MPTSHCMVVAVGKGIDRAHAKSEARSTVRKPIMWEILTVGREAVERMGVTGSLLWKGLALFTSFALSSLTSLGVREWTDAFRVLSD